MLASSAPQRSQYHSLGLFIAPHSTHLSVFWICADPDGRSVSGESLVICIGVFSFAPTGCCCGVPSGVLVATESRFGSGCCCGCATTGAGGVGFFCSTACVLPGVGTRGRSPLVRLTCPPGGVLDA